MNQIVRNTKQFSAAEDAALKMLDPALKSACRIANVPEPEIDPKWDSTRIRTPFSVLFSLRFQKTVQVVCGTVKIDGIQYMSEQSANGAVGVLRDYLFSVHSASAALRKRIATADLKDRVLHESVAAMTSKTCDGCGGIGSYTCSPCGGGGICTCRNCFNSGYVSCTQCNGRGGTDGGSGPSIQCYGCNGKGRVYCHSCNGTLRVTCSGCNGHGSIGCGECARTGVLTTIYGGKLTSSAKFTMGKTLLNKRQTGLLNIWAQAGFNGRKATDDLVTPWTDIDTAPVTKLDGAQDYRVNFNCDVTLTRLDFSYDGKPAWAEYVHLPLATPEFSPFLDTAAGKAVLATEGASSPSGIARSLDRSGYSQIASMLSKGTEDFGERLRAASYGAISGNTLSSLSGSYASASERFAKGAMLRAWKLPVFATMASWATASHFGITEAAADQETIYPMAGLALAAGFVAVATSNIEARRAITAETGNVRGMKIGPAALLTGAAAALLFWTSSYYGITL